MSLKVSVSYNSRGGWITYKTTTYLSVVYHVPKHIYILYTLLNTLCQLYITQRHIINILYTYAHIYNVDGYKLTVTPFMTAHPTLDLVQSCPMVWRQSHATLENP